ncbi:MAG: PEGA domain-containing protein [Polyangia bacterium]|jgi:hypothetical protein|nr:PEGA domain-containing protein [Polyangia bacterium]
MRPYRSCLLLSAVILACGLLSSLEAQGRARARRITGTLLIQSNTTGAKVFVDGDEVGTVPLPQPIKLLPGPHSVKVVKPGHTQFMESVAIRPGKTVKLEVDLFPIQGVLTLDSAPSGARVYMAGKFLGKTPLVKVEVPAGEQKLRVSRVGFYDVIRTLKITAGAETKLLLPLIPLPADINPLIPKVPPKKWYDQWWVWVSAAGGLVALVTAIAVPTALATKDPVKDFGAERTFRVPLRVAPW